MEHSPEEAPVIEKGPASSFREGVMVGAGLKESSDAGRVGSSPEEQGAFNMGVQRGMELAKDFSDPEQLAYEAGRAVGSYQKERGLLN